MQVGLILIIAALIGIFLLVGGKEKIADIIKPKPEDEEEPPPEVEEKWIYIEEFSEGGHITSNPKPKRKGDKKWYYNYGTTVKLTAVANSGYRFKKWSLLSEIKDKYTNPATVYMTENIGDSLRKTVAEFEQVGDLVGYYEVKVASDPFIGGWVVQEPDKDKYAFGEIIRLTAKENRVLGYTFEAWYSNGQFVDTNNPIDFMVTKSCTVKAYFKRY